MTTSIGSRGARSKRALVAYLFWPFVLMMIIMPLWIWWQAFADAQRQHWIVTHYQPVQAKVLSARGEKHSGDHGHVYYEVDITYEYSVGNKTYQSDQFAAVRESGSEQWANSVVIHYVPGHSCDAFYDPANPEQAVLLRRYVFSPYYELLQCAFILSFGCAWVSYLWFARKPKLVPADNGWFSLAPESGERQRLVAAKVGTIMWYALGLIPLAHYYACVPPPHRSGAFEFFFALGLIPLAFFIRYWRMNRNMDEALLLVEREEGVLGQTWRATLTQTIRRQLELKQASLRLVCLGVKKQGKSSTSTVLFEKVLGEAPASILHPGEDLALSGDITLPAEQQPSGRDAKGKYDWIVWKMRYRCELAHAPDYSTEYRIEVKAPTIEDPVPLITPIKSVDIRAVERECAGRIQSKYHQTIAAVLTLFPIVVQLAGIGLCVSVFPVVFPDKEHPMQPFWNLPKVQAQEVFDAGIALVLLSSVWGIGYSSVMRTAYMRGVTRREIKRRRESFVRPEDDGLFVEIIPRTNWNRTMWRNETDTGLLVVDSALREIRFEGDKERYRIPADALLSCKIEKSLLSSTAKPDAPGIFLVVLRAPTDSGVWEAPFAPIVSRSVFNSKRRQRAAEALQAKIKSLHPSIVMETKSSEPA